MKITTFLISLTLLSCTVSPTTAWIWYKEGGTVNELSKDKYSCLLNSQQRIFDAQGSTSLEVNGQLHQFAGHVTERVVTNDVLFNACMNAHGWYPKAFIQQ